jgi:hypothetical protein
MERFADKSYREERDALHYSVCRGTEVLVVYPPLLGVHRYEGVTDDIIEEWTGVDGVEDGSERFCLWITEHHEFVARDGLVEVKLISRGLVVDKLLVSK